jgi:hypothetical protein
VNFEKDGKSYSVIIKIGKIREGWFRDEIKELEIILCSNSDFVIDYSENSEKKSG